MKFFLVCAAIAQLLFSEATGRILQSVVERRSAQSNCTQDSPEYFRRNVALQCQESYINAVEEEIARSNCNNTIYTDVYGGVYEDEPCEGPRDNRENVPECSDLCAMRQFNYLQCIYLGEQYAALRNDCMDPLDGSEYCGYYDGGFCLEKENLTIPVRNTCFSHSEGSITIRCSEECRVAVDRFRTKTGCCAPFLLVIEDVYDEPRTEEIFSVCQEQVPTVCRGYSPPVEFLNCAHNSNATEEPTIGNSAGKSPFAGSTVFLASIGLIMAKL